MSGRAVPTAGSEASPPAQLCLLRVSAALSAQPCAVRFRSHTQGQTPRAPARPSVQPREPCRARPCPGAQRALAPGGVGCPLGSRVLRPASCSCATCLSFPKTLFARITSSFH